MKRPAIGPKGRGLGRACAVAYSLFVALPAARRPNAAERRGREAAMKGATQRAPDYARDVAPLFRKYCLGCHNAQEAQGGLVLESHTQVLHGGEHGAIVVAGNAERAG